MTALANVIRAKANIQTALSISGMVDAINNLSGDNIDITLGEIDQNGNFQPISFDGTTVSANGQAIQISNYYTWNNSYMSTSTVESLTPEELSGSLTLMAAEDNSTVILSGIGSVVSRLQYRTNSNITWTDYQINTPITLENTNDYVQFKNNSNQLSRSSNDYVQFIMSGTIKASGNIQSMLNYSNSCTSYCYSNMFRNCKSLTTAPALPATTLATNCYYGMFQICTSLSSIEVEFTDWNSSSNSTTDWLYGVASTGIFTKPASLEPLSGANNIPNNWTVINK